MDDQHIIVKTLRVATSAGQTEVAGHPNPLVATRLNAVLQQHPVEVFFVPTSAATARVTTTVVPDLPPNVHLQTFRTSLRWLVTKPPPAFLIHGILSDFGAHVCGT